MPIIEDEIKYTMPENIRSQITRDFCLKLRDELTKIFNLNIKQYNSYEILELCSTNGWDNALKSTCYSLNMESFYNYYNDLSWCDSDDFDGYILDVMVDTMTLIYGNLIGLIAEKLNLSVTDYAYCFECGDYYLVNNMTFNKCNGTYICNKCKNKNN